MNQNENPNCCEEMKSSADIISWAKADGWEKLGKDTWAMMVHRWESAEFIAINFCPFCGTRLEPPYFKIDE